MFENRAKNWDVSKITGLCGYNSYEEKHLAIMDDIRRIHIRLDNIEKRTEKRKEELRQKFKRRM